MQLLPFINRYLTAEIPFEETSLYKKTILINSILAFATLIFLFFGFYNLTREESLIAFMDFTAALLTAAAVLDLRFNKNVTRAGDVGIGALFFFFLSFILINQNRDFGLVWTLFFPVFTILIRSKSGFPAIFLFYALLLPLAYLNIGVWQEGAWSLTGFIRFTAASLLLTYVVYVVEATRQKVDEKNRELLLREKEYSARLEEYKGELEKKVEKSLAELGEKERIILRNAQLAELGNLIGVIAHQLKQPLNSINLQMYNIYDATVAGEADPAFLEREFRNVEKQIGFMSATVDDFQNFYNPNKTKSLFNMAETVRKTEKLLASQLQNSGIELESRLDDTLFVNGHESELQQVLINLVHNAKDALLQRRAERPVIRLRCASDQGRPRLQIEDNGGGVAQEAMEQLFQPYFTTKGTEGTGIGLYLVQKIVRESFGGSIRVSNTGEGALFTIDFPPAAPLEG